MTEGAGFLISPVTGSILVFFPSPTLIVNTCFNPFSVIAVTVAVPFATAVTVASTFASLSVFFPVTSTDATAVSLEIKDTSESVSAAFSFTFKELVSPAFASVTVFWETISIFVASFFAGPAVSLKERFATVNVIEYTIGALASAMSGSAMAVAIGYALHCPPLVLFSLITVGFASNALGGAGGPLAVYFIAVIASEFGKAISKETRIDILVTPLVTIATGIAASALLAPTLGRAALKIGELIMLATNLQPFLMGIVVSVLMGIALTLPISSAAICAAFGLTGLAGGAAVAGCCAQMVGFAVISFSENKFGGLVSQGIGTSMLQMGNIIKNPKIWIAPIVTSAITGPIATCLFHIEMNGTAVSSGMGTCGFVGQIGVYTGWVNDITQGLKTAITMQDWIGLFMISFILPAILCPAINMVLQKIGWVKKGDMKLS